MSAPLVLDDDGTAHALDGDEPKTLCGIYVPGNWTTPSAMTFTPGQEPHYGPTCSQCAQIYNRRKRTREF
jgi:hypothetical protein